MLSVVIATHDSERALLPTLAALVAGAAAGVVREVIVADAGSRDATAAIADGAGCRLLTSAQTRGAASRPPRQPRARRGSCFSHPAPCPTPPGSKRPGASSSRPNCADAAPAVPPRSAPVGRRSAPRWSRRSLCSGQRSAPGRMRARGCSSPGAFTTRSAGTATCRSPSATLAAASAGAASCCCGRERWRIHIVDFVIYLVDYVMYLIDRAPGHVRPVPRAARRRGPPLQPRLHATHRRAAGELP